MTFMINPVHKKSLEPPSDKEIKEIESDLYSLASLLEGVRYELSGGLAIDLTMQVYTGIASQIIPALNKSAFIRREHKAFHISINESELEKLESRIKNHKYTLVFRKWDIHLPPTGKKSDLYCKISAKNITEQDDLKKRIKNLRFVRIDDKGDILPHQNRLDYLDIFPYRYESWNKEILTPWFNDRFFIRGTCRTFSEQETYVNSWDTKKGEVLKMPFSLYKGVEYELKDWKIRLVSLNWIKYVKERRTRQDEVDLDDIFLIDKCLELKKGMCLQHSYESIIQ